MSFFDDIGDAVSGAIGDLGSVASTVVSTVGGIAKSGFGQTVLNLGGSLFGDPGLGSQVATGIGILDKVGSLFSGGRGRGGAAHPMTRSRDPFFGQPMGGAGARALTGGQGYAPMPIGAKATRRAVHAASGWYVVTFRGGKAVSARLVHPADGPAFAPPAVRKPPPPLPQTGDMLSGAQITAALVSPASIPDTTIAYIPPSKASIALDLQQAGVNVIVSGSQNMPPPDPSPGTRVHNDL